MCVRHLLFRFLKYYCCLFRHLQRTNVNNTTQGLCFAHIMISIADEPMGGDCCESGRMMLLLLLLLLPMMTSGCAATLPPPLASTGTSEVDVCAGGRVTEAVIGASSSSSSSSSDTITRRRREGRVGGGRGDVELAADSDGFEAALAGGSIDLVAAAAAIEGAGCGTSCATLLPWLNSKKSSSCAPCSSCMQDWPTCSQK